MTLFHLFSSSILSQYPATPLNSTLLIQTRRSSAAPIFNSHSHRAEIPVSHPTEEVGSKQCPERRIASFAIRKKKKKLRPSFYDQTRERWSVKIASQRTKFPWQQQKQPQYFEDPEDSGQEEDEEEEEEESGGEEKVKWVGERFPSILNSAIPLNATKGEDPWSENPISLPFENCITFAPWHKPRKTHLDFEDQLHVPSGKIERRREDQEKESLGRGSLEDFKRGRDGNVNEECSSSSSGDEDDGDFMVSIVEKMKEFGDDSKNSSLNDKRSGSNVKVLSSLESTGDSVQNRSGSRNGSDGELMGSCSKGDSIQMPWAREKWNRNNTELAEKIIPEPELRRLRNIALRMKERLTVGVAGLTQAIVDEIHEKWKEVEVVKMKFEGPSALNMKRTHNILESKTGGLVIWRCGSSIVLYRGMAYKLPCVKSFAKHSQATHDIVPYLEESTSDAKTARGSNFSSVPDFEDPCDEFTDITNVNNMLDELGPRFLDWSGCDPVPVDADLLPGVVPGYKPPFRFLPYGIKRSLQNKEVTNLRRLARKMPPHFALGRNREHQGLAKAMVKLWEKSVIAKIAIKRGVLNTHNERMAEELKKLTGGTLLSRNKDFIVFYRGNDFLSPAMKEALLEREKLVILRQDEEEQARMTASGSLVLNAKAARGPFLAGTLAETMEARSHWGHQPNSEEIEKMKRDESLAKHAALVRHLENKLAKAQEKVRKAEKALCKVQAFLEPAELPTDLETVTDEERFLFRKIGLSMKPYLLLGRRGVFDGTVENMHLHWKYKELVKVIVKGKSLPQVKHIAISLEAESGGILISLDKTSKGYAIIFYRGKNYQRPKTMRPENLLTKRQALARSIELQRREALNHHISEMKKRIELLKSELEQMENVKEIDDGDLYSRFAEAYPSDDDLEEEGEEAFLRTYDSGNESDVAESKECASEIE